MDTPRHIVILTQQFGAITSGVGTYANFIVEALLLRGYRITLICPQENEETAFPGRLEFVRVPRPRLRSGARWIPLAWSFARALKKLLSSCTPDLVYFVDAREAAFVDPPCPMFGTVHDGYAASAPINPLRMRPHYADWLQRWAFYQVTAYLEARAFKRYDGLHYVCDFTRLQVESRHGVHAPLNWTEHLGLNTDRFPPESAIPGVAERQRGKILTVGGNPERKGVHNLVRSLPEVRKRIPEAHLFIAGGSEHRAIARTARELGVDRAVTWLGWQTPEELREHYLTAAVFAMPSLVESLALVYLEAAIYGAPVLATTNCGLSELLGEEAAHYCRPAELRELSSGLIRLMEDGEYAQGLVDAAMPIVRQRDISEVALRVGEMFEDVMAQVHRA